MKKAICTIWGALFAVAFAHLKAAEEPMVILSTRSSVPLEHGVQDGQSAADVDAKATSTDGVPRIETQIAPAFTEHITLAYRRPISDSVSIKSSTALEMNRGGWLTASK